MGCSQRIDRLKNYPDPVFSLLPSWWRGRLRGGLDFPLRCLNQCQITYMRYHGIGFKGICFLLRGWRRRKCFWLPVIFSIYADEHYEQLYFALMATQWPSIWRVRLWPSSEQAILGHGRRGGGKMFEAPDKKNKIKGEKMRKVLGTLFNG